MRWRAISTSFSSSLTAYSRVVRVSSTSSTIRIHFIVAKRFVEGETDGLDGDVGSAALLEERSEDSSRDVTTTTDGDQKLGLKVGEELLSGLLAHLVHLEGMSARVQCILCHLKQL
jgi:cytochrome c